MLRSCSHVLALGFISALMFPATQSVAQSWPQRTVRLIVPVGPGAVPDVPARLFANRLSERWKQPVIVENRTGAEGLIGVAAFSSMRDNHTLLVSFAGPITVFPLLQERIPYDPDRDLVPISLITTSFGAVAAPTSLNVKSLAELVALVQARPGKLNYFSG